MRFRPADIFTLFIGLAILAAMVAAWDWPLRASIIVLVLGSAGLVMVAAQLILDLGRSRRKPAPAPRLAFEIPSFEEGGPQAFPRGALEVWCWLVGLLLAVFVVGLPAALVLFVFLYMKCHGAGWFLSLGMAAAIAGFEYGVYDRIMHVYWPEALIWRLFE